MTDEKLVELAFSMLERSYSPYSRFAVGAALLCTDGAVFTGCNIENAAYGATICAERSAVAAAVSAGNREFSKIAIAARSRDYCVPCGTCRQVLHEFAPELIYLCARKDGQYRVFRTEELLPNGFGKEDMEK
ncbi:cytidine deaminase [Papillibacter cinnamivorans]|uniref:Cytidine deaminase n=1 Tax=Papillibacter cinnamivorans DSM 12816 TaxID=1122930 RepID=A0A1W2BGM2_9FIRM|nr:cytidine deaminase [Papillibacter cinnamivorans]SMC71598.1 cytidine deaminase [Papillibacter cinnamivorans DSM 12816]